MGEITLGNKVRDTVTEFTGMATGKAEYLHTTTQILVEAKIADDGTTRSIWIEESRLEVMTPETP